MAIIRHSPIYFLETISVPIVLCRVKNNETFDLLSFGKLSER